MSPADDDAIIDGLEIDVSSWRHPGLLPQFLRNYDLALRSYALSHTSSV